MRYIGIITLLVLCLTLLLLTGCMINTVKPEPASGNLENQEDINQSSNNSQSSSTGPIYEPGTEEPATEEPAEEPATEEPATVYPQKWATGDGTVGDPWANDCIKTALTNTPVGGTVYLKAGYYILSTSVNVTKQVNVIGEGRNKTIIITADAFGFNINTVNYVTLKGFTIDGDAQTEGIEAGYLSPISIGHSDYILLEDIEVKNAGYYGICLYESNHSLLQNIYAHDNYRHGVSGSADTTENNMYNTYRDIYAWDNGFCGFDDRGIQTSDFFDALYNTYDNLQCWDNGNYGISLTYMSGSVLSNSFVSGNEIIGIRLGHIEDSTINNCLVTLNEKVGLEIANSKNVNFTNVIVKNNKTGINIYNSSELVFTSCQSYDDRATPLQKYGIELGEDANTGLTFLNCKLTPNRKGDIYNPAGVVLTVIAEKKKVVQVLVALSVVIVLCIFLVFSKICR